MTDRTATVTVTAAQARFADWMTDVLIYIVVLNLFVEYVDAVIIDSFTISILTAIVLKALLDVILGFEHRIKSWFGRREGASWRIIGTATVLAVLFFSKFVILEIIDLIFREHVELGHLIEVVALIITMMVAREVVGRIYRGLGVPGERASFD